MKIFCLHRDNPPNNDKDDKTPEVTLIVNRKTVRRMDIQKVKKDNAQSGYKDSSFHVAMDSYDDNWDDMYKPYVYDIQMLTKEMAYESYDGKNSQGFKDIAMLDIFFFLLVHYAFGNLKIKPRDKSSNTANIILLDKSMIYTLFKILCIVWCLV